MIDLRVPIGSGNSSAHPSVVSARDGRVLPILQFRSTDRSTKWAVLHDYGGLRRSPRVCKSLKNLKTVDCHGRGRGFEPRRPRQILKDLSPFWHVTSRYKKVQVKNLSLNWKVGRRIQVQQQAPCAGPVLLLRSYRPMHYCPATSRTDSIGCKYRLSRYRSPSLEVPVEWAFSRTELG